MKRMRSSNLPIFFATLSCCCFFSNFLNTFASLSRHLCRPDQKDALLDFKNEFRIQKPEFAAPSDDGLINFMSNPNLVDFTSYPKTKSWKNSSDCCYWEGVTCDAESGEVIGLDLSFSCLTGPLKPNSSLFRLHHLRSLNLAYNNFSSSSIPAEFGKLTRLTRLNLSYSAFAGRIPAELLQLTELVSLDLSTFDFYRDLFTEEPFLSGLAQNLTNLRALYLRQVDISSTVPKNFVNLSSLRSLHLGGSNLLGEFPGGVFQLPHIKLIELYGNTNLTFSLPEFHTNNSLTVLDLSLATSLGSLPHSIGNLKSLNVLKLGSCNFTGTIPSSLGNLSHLTSLDLSSNNFIGAFPVSLFELPSLNWIDSSRNQLSGPLVFGNTSSSSKLAFLLINSNNFDGPIPRSISKFANLEALDLSDLNSIGVVDLSVFSHLESLYYLNLSGNSVSVANVSSASYFPLRLQLLWLSACNISEFPEFLRTQGDLLHLDLSRNRIKGQVPEWLWRMPNLSFLNISYNSIISFEGSSKILRSTGFEIIDLRSNAFQGPFPVPSLSTVFLYASENNFTGKLPRSICKLNSLEILDLSNNHFSGSIPRCLGNLSSVLSFLNLRNNNLSGTLPKAFVKGSNLRTLDVSHNRLVGKLPRSLVSCTSLQVLNVESNRINDTFPFWLGTLSRIQVLVLRSNEFYGPIYLPWVSFGFPKLRIIDISHNDFNGTLPPDYFANWSAMSSIGTNEDRSQLKYMGDDRGFYQDSVVLMSKGVEIMFVKILTIYTSIDFSGNRFQGQIPESIGLLKELKLLNLSNNAFRGQIPTSLTSLTELESLDLSQNRLSGKIPPEFGNLSFLGYVNLSHNQLVGPIPQGTQFQRQPSSSFEGNPRLCGPPLQKSCGDVSTPSQATPVSQETQPPKPKEEVLSWIAAAISFAPGLVFGLTIGHIFTSYKHEWFTNIFSQNRRRRTRAR